MAGLAFQNLRQIVARIERVESDRLLHPSHHPESARTATSFASQHRRYSPRQRIQFEGLANYLATLRQHGGGITGNEHDGQTRQSLAHDLGHLPTIHAARHDPHR